MDSVKEAITKQEKLIEPNHPLLQYSGRINWKEGYIPQLIYPCTSVTIRFTGTRISMVVQNKRWNWDNYLGFLIDGKQGMVRLNLDGMQKIMLADSLTDGEHTVMVFKRMDGCHITDFHGFVVDEDTKVLELPPKPIRKMEFYGDSVSVGEVVEAVDYVGKEDPDHHGEFCNSYYSFAWVTARKLNAQIYNNSQGGIALMDGSGWFLYPNYVGLEHTFDKLLYNPELGEVNRWDFEQYTPDVVVVAIGQNDSHPFDIMKENYHSRAAREWRDHYEMFLDRLRSVYHHATIVCMTTILNHDKGWDDSIDEVVARMGDPGIHHFVCSKCGCGTPGHLRIAEDEKLAEELTAFIEKLGNGIWESE